MYFGVCLNIIWCAATLTCNSRCLSASFQVISQSEGESTGAITVFVPVYPLFASGAKLIGRLIWKGGFLEQIPGEADASRSGSRAWRERLALLDAWTQFSSHLHDNTFSTSPKHRTNEVSKSDTVMVRAGRHRAGWPAPGR